MEVKLNLKKYPESQPFLTRIDMSALPFMPRVNIGQLSALFAAWGIDEQTIRSMSIEIEHDEHMYLEGRLGEYHGELNGVHFISVCPNLLLYQSASGLGLNEAVIHECLHVYWNIVSPGDHVLPNGLRYRYTPQSFGPDEEEVDCRKIQRIYKKKFKVLSCPTRFNILVSRMKSVLGQKSMPVAR